MRFRGYVIGAVLLLSLLVATTALGAGFGFAISLLSGNEAIRVVAMGLGSFFGLVFGVGMCREAIAFASATLRSRRTTKPLPTKEV